ncbi:ABC transporter permease [Nocardioides sp. SYSU DS0663]|uniref:ABC transporter permease n=1 Tax=Nocardioides sp. SYSU DS0663 TaxID=3416445 RepID=UPI003F4B37E5
MTGHLATLPADEVPWRLAGALVALVLLAAGTSRLTGLGVARQQVTAALRAVAQLAVVALVIVAVLASTGWSLAFVALMFLVATATSGRRVAVPDRQLPWLGLALAAGAVPVVALAGLSGVVRLDERGLIPMAGIVVGGAMTAATLSGRRAAQELVARHGELEAALALGLSRQEATHLVLEPTAREALVPGLDQTRTVGLVALPGAFVGVLLAGGSPVEAASAQVLVLVALLAAQAVSVAVLLRLVAAGRVTPGVGRDAQRGGSGGTRSTRSVVASSS